MHPLFQQSNGTDMQVIGDKIVRRFECECEWLFVSIQQSCDGRATCPGRRLHPPNVSWD